MDMNIAKILFVLGAVLMLFGLVALYVQRVPWLYSWFGHLPGDIRIESDRALVFVPLSSMVVLSLAVTIVLQVVQRFIR